MKINIRCSKTQKVINYKEKELKNKNWNISISRRISHYERFQIQIVDQLKIILVWCDVCENLIKSFNLSTFLFNFQSSSVFVFFNFQENCSFLYVKSYDFHFFFSFIISQLFWFIHFSLIWHRTLQCGVIKYHHYRVFKCLWL